MDSQKQDVLNAAGVNVEQALARFMNNEKMLTKYLGRFTTDKSYADLEAAMAANDHEAAKIAAHTLKSVCGTLRCDNMYALVIEQETAMRSDDWDKATKLMPEITAEYNKICQAIQSCNL